MSTSAFPDLIVVGSGFFGATVAERVARVANKRVLVIEKRSHIGGNAYSYTHAESEIEVHKYGMHIFHTSNQRVIDYILQFTEFNDYRHKVYSRHKGELYPLPINLRTIRQIFGEEFSPEQAQAFVEAEVKNSGILNLPSDSNLKNKALSTVGPTLYEALIRGYTMKQWQMDPELLPASTITRLPVRFDLNDNYFSDDFQGIPKDGYTNIFNRMLNHPNITTLTDTDFFATQWAGSTEVPIVYTGPIDQYFNYKFGELNWRTLDFETTVHPVANFQGTAVINEADIEVPWTRSLEFRHLQIHRTFDSELSVVSREYSRKAERKDEPFYPVNTDVDREKLLKYRHLAGTLKNIIFGGRLGRYQYLDMHMAIASALKCYEGEISPRWH